ncbi:hypothetical protein JR316_0012817 [Psilocybe cubensis]|uniref:Uncharacterized protein n=1 Tax=Psilocybe cubensis TaxID=181762 RepID=A0ACB8GFW9_PSICU|nr:hypothetical protein JR316_0012817 [Psilocybe cubensis]KAH9474359.1 hypothetical protein JR316_0012817 [Psilocybe cubensis]
MSSSSHAEERSTSQGYLPRGGACKCDGKRPICSQCDRAGRAEDCEYTVGQERSTVQILEENISRLEARIQELQNPAPPASSAIELHQPYGVSSSDFNGIGSNSRYLLQDLPAHLAEALINNFMPHAGQIGFFLNLPRFQASLLNGQAPGRMTRPSCALAAATYLWAIRLSNDRSVKAHEHTYLTRATQQAATALSGQHPDRVMQSIQAEVLLATYFFANGRFFEGKYHVTTAVSMVFSAGLHKIRSSAPQQQSVTGSSTRLPEPKDSIEEGERIMALWTVLDLDKHWAIALEHTPNFEYSTHPLATKVDTPWPLEMDEFEQDRLPSYAITSNTIYNFLNSITTPDLGISLRAIESKTAILWERVAVFTRKCNARTSQQSLQPLVEEFTGLSNLLDSVLGLLPSLDPQSIGRIQSVEMARRYGVVYSILCSAFIRLHAPFAFSGRSESSLRKRLSMARTILELAIGLRGRGVGYLNPIIGTVWIEASQVVFDEVSRIRSMRTSGTLLPGGPDERVMLGLVNRATQAMAGFTMNIPLTSFQVAKIQETSQLN